MPAQRTKNQKFWFKQMSVFWAKSKRLRPWKHALENGVVKIRWLCTNKNYRMTIPIGIVMDWCEDQGFKVFYESIHNVPGYKYFSIHYNWKYYPFTLTVEIPAE